MAAVQPIPERRDVDAATFRAEIVPAYRPVVLRGLVSDWPAVRAEEIGAYLRAFDNGAPVEVFAGANGGRFFYRDDMSGVNFERVRRPLGALLDDLLALPEVDPPVSMYAGAVPIADCLPGFAAANPLALLDGVPPRLWVGNASLVAAHHDLSDNIACVVAGRRRFTLFPPDQVSNLYVGPIDNTVAGQPASLAVVQSPDLERYPRLQTALASALAADLGPGDALYIPSLWWHSVQSFGPLVNYWWDDRPPDAGSPFDAMVHGLLAIADLPQARREAWRSLFEHYVFRRDGDPVPHLAAEHRGVLGPSTPDLRRRIRAFLMQALGRR